MTDLEKLRGFAQEIMEGWPFGDIDGADLQEIATKWELLVPQTMTEPCCEACECASMDAFPLTCYRKTPLLTGKPIAHYEAQHAEESQ